VGSGIEGMIIMILTSILIGKIGIN